MDESDRGGAPAGEVTALLLAWAAGDRTALDRLMPLVYEELRQLAHRELRGERPGRELSTTALVHEAFLRLVDQGRARLEGRRHFLAVAGKTMRRVLVDEARKRRAAKRGGGAPHLPLDEAPEVFASPDTELLALDDALSALDAFDAELGRLVELRYFAGLTLEETATVLGVATTTVWRDWQVARAWLFARMADR
jgi:RNA polymerase sigma factor (TIGR02999 family)